METLSPREITTAAILAGAVALTGAGCTQKTQEPIEPEPAVAYEVPADTDALPSVSEYEPSYREPSRIGTFNTARFIRRLETEDFKWLTNDYSDPVNRLPSGGSAPILDFMIGSDGKLRFESQNERPSRDEVNLLSVVHTTEPMLSAALRSGDIRQAHIRAFQPNMFPDHPEWEPTMEATFVQRDSNDGGNPAMYLYLPADSFVDPEAVALLFSHEIGHALSGHAESVQIAPEQASVFAEACSAIYSSAVEHVRQDSLTLRWELERLHAVVPPEYVPVLEEISTSLESGTYRDLPLAHPEAAYGVPDCYLQDPWGAFKGLVKEKDINNGKIKLLNDKLDKLGTGLEFEEGMHEAVLDWHDIVREHAVVSALSESTYLPLGGENQPIGHPYEGLPEMQASVANLLLTLPDELGQHVAGLPDEQKSIVLTIVGEIKAAVTESYEDDEQFTEFANAQYETFLEQAV